MQQELEVLREIGRVSAYQGSNALSEFLGSEIVLKPSSAEVIDTDKIPTIEIDKIGVAIYSRLAQGLRGEIVFILDEHNAFRLIDLSKMRGGENKELGVLTEMGVSVIKEIGNIVIGSYITALSLTLKRMIVPPLPTFLSGSLEHIFIDFIFTPYVKREEHQNYFIQTLFEAPQEKIKGYLCLILPEDTVQDIRRNYKGPHEEGGSKEQLSS